MANCPKIANDNGAARRNQQIRGHANVEAADEFRLDVAAAGIEIAETPLESVDVVQREVALPETSHFCRASSVGVRVASRRKKAKLS
jgi:hypothetical protein